LILTPMALEEEMIKLWLEELLQIPELSINLHQRLDLKQLIFQQVKFSIFMMLPKNIVKKDIK